MYVKVTPLSLFHFSKFNLGVCLYNHSHGQSLVPHSVKAHGTMAANDRSRPTSLAITVYARAICALFFLFWPLKNLGA